MVAKHKSRNEYTKDQQIQRAMLKLVQKFLNIVGDSINAFLICFMIGARLDCCIALVIPPK